MAVWNPKANEVFVNALDISNPAERRVMLDRECGSDAALREQVEKLLHAHDSAGSFLQQPAPGCEPTVIPERLASDVIGSRIGPYKLLQEIGEGGMGTVYMAEQTSPVKRMVALKVIKPGMDTAQVVARFEAERQALALMDHPNIARVLDAGTTEIGRPYFVMELVKGVMITKYCDEHLLTPRERMALFVPVCQAIQHAHQKGIIHRDLKPSNVMVASYDGQPVPKVIDFGVAKAMGQQLTERTMFTGFGGIVGTLEYMSPEQAEFNALDVDTRSDIYSLGVLLYELLTGSTPLTKQQLKQAAITELLRLIREEEPPKPSTRLTESSDSLASLSAQRRLDPSKLTKEVSGELDWIVMKALEKDRTRRYETANSLARDVERYLRDEQVEACPPTLGYRMRKLARKYRKSLITAVSFTFFFVIAFTAVTWQAYRAAKAEQRAVVEAQLARKASEAENEQRRRAELEREKATDALARSQFDQANAVRLTGLPGRRWVVLDLLMQAEMLRSRVRPKSVADAASVGASKNVTDTASVGVSDAGSVRHVTLPLQSELRTDAVAALMLNDGRVARHWRGFTHSVSPDGRFLASFSVEDNGGLTIMDLRSGDIVRNWNGNGEQTPDGTILALGPRGETLATVSLDQRQIVVWDLVEKKTVRTLTQPSLIADNANELSGGETSAAPTHGGPCRQIVFSPDGRWLAAVMCGNSGEGIITLWNEEGPLEGQALATIRPITAAPVSFSPDSRFLAFVSGAKNAMVWNVAENRAEREIELPISPDGAVGFHPRGELLGIHGQNREPGASTASSVLLWDIAQNLESARLDTGTLIATTPISFAPDGRRLAVGGSNRTIAVLELPANGHREAPLVQLNHGLLPQMIAWTESGQLLSGGLDGVNQWEFASADAVTTLRLDTDQAANGVSRLAFSPDGRTLAAEAWPGPHIAMFETALGQRIRSWETSLEVGDVGLRFSPDGEQLFRYGQFGVRSWKVDTGEEQKRLSNTSKVGAVTSVGVRPDGSQLVADISLSSVVSIQDMALGKVIWQSERPEFGASAIVSPNGSFFAAWRGSAIGGGDRSIRVWNTEGNRERFSLSSPERDSFQTTVVISPDSRWIAALHYGEGEDWASPAQFTFGAGFASIVNPDREWFGDVWNSETGKRQCQLYGPKNVENYAFSPDGRYLAVGMRGGAIRVWDITTATELFDWQRPSGLNESQAIPRQLAFSADSTAIAVSDLSSPSLHLLNLDRVNEQLREYSLGW